MSDYLWDRSGPPDLEIAKLERVLARFRYGRRESRRRVWAAMAAAAVVTIAAWQLERAEAPRATAWNVSGSGSRLVAGERLLTGAARVTIEAGDFGRVDVEPGSDLRVVESSPGRQRMTLERGRIHALIWAAPRQFVVDTPSARAVDLGCQYSLSVDAAGNGLLDVETGWVAFQFRGRESFIPAGARCQTFRRSGPGIPFFGDASAEFTGALTEFERTGRAVALAAVLAHARAKDALSLWHLLSRTDGEERRLVFVRFAGLVPLPREVHEERVMAGDREALDACWNALKLDDVGWWREWKRDWRP